MDPIAMTLLLVFTLGGFAWTAHRRIRQLASGTRHPRFTLANGEWFGRTVDLIDYALLQRRMRDPGSRYVATGLAHILIFWGFLVLGLNSLLLVIRGYDAHFDFWGVLAEDAPLGMLYAFTKDSFILAVLAGVAVFVYYRLKKTQRMTLSGEANLILGIISTMMVSDLLYNGAWFLREARMAGEPYTFMPASFAASAIALWFQQIGVSDGTLTAFAHIGFWVHVGLVLIFLNILPFSKHFHILTVFQNTFAHDRAPLGQLPNVEDLMGKVEREEAVGINKITDLSWKHMLDLYTCTECGRCSDNCPAYTTGKKLSPKHLTLALRDHLFDTEKAMFGDDGIVAFNAEHHAPGAKDPLHTTPPPPADAYFRSSEVVSLVPNVLDPDVLWACTTCRACEEQCPVMISYVDKIVGMRRELVLMKADFPPDLQRPFMGMETNGNPWNLSRMDRAGWADGLAVPTIADKPDAQVLYWVGCAAAYDHRAKKVARSVAKLLKHAGVDFAILGTKESCTGDPARRAGNEYLFQMLAEANVETLNAIGADKKQIITACPHCFNSLLNEYPQFGGKYDVVHHSAFLQGLLVAGKLVPTQPVNSKVVYHDSCYLGRYNKVYDSPRKVLEAIPGLELLEVDTWNKEKGLCCGAGGAQMWMEERHGTQRVNTKRTLQLLDTGANAVASGCPFCMTMLSDGLKAESKEEQVAQLDIAEMLATAVGLDEPVIAQAAE